MILDIVETREELLRMKRKMRKILEHISDLSDLSPGLEIERELGALRTKLGSVLRCKIKEIIDGLPEEAFDSIDVSVVDNDGRRTAFYFDGIVLFHGGVYSSKHVHVVRKGHFGAVIRMCTSERGYVAECRDRDPRQIEYCPDISSEEYFYLSRDILGALIGRIDELLKAETETGGGE